MSKALADSGETGQVCVAHLGTAALQAHIDVLPLPALHIEHFLPVVAPELTPAACAGYCGGAGPGQLALAERRPGESSGVFRAVSPAC